jgi:hypothetical protein
MTAINWKSEIVTLVYVKEVVADLDVHHLFPHHFPKVAATRTKIIKCQRLLGHALDDEHVELLLYADGWDGFLQSIDLFGTSDFCGSDRYLVANELLNAYDDGILADVGLAKSNLFPIGADVIDRDLFIMVKPGVKSSMRIFWLAEKEIARFPSFSEFFLSIVDHNRSLIETVQRINNEYEFPESRHAACD